MINSDNFHTVEDLKFNPEKLNEALQQILKIKSKRLKILQTLDALIIQTQEVVA